MGSKPRRCARLVESGQSSDTVSHVRLMHCPIPIYNYSHGITISLYLKEQETNARERPMTQMIGNRYEIQAQIGAGGMGTVFRGVDTQTSQPVAIKQLKPDLSQPELIERFKREGDALRQLNHPNIV